MATPRSLRAGLTVSRGDVALAAVAVAAMQWEVWGFWVEAEQGPKALAAALGTVMGGALAWCRRSPVAALAIVVGTQVVWTLVSVPQGSLTPYLINLVAVFSCALRTPLTTAAIGLVTTVAAQVLFVAVTTNNFADYTFILAFLLGAWASGRALRSRQRRADELFTRTVRLEVEKEEQGRLARDQERSRIAREMHDVISHSVSVMVVQAAAAERVLDQDPEAAREALRAVQDTGRGARLELRRMLGLLRTSSADLAPQPDFDRLPALLEQVARAGLEVRVELSGTPRGLPAGISLTAYRVVQEALTNALAHGEPKHAQLCVQYDDGAIVLQVDNPVRDRAPSEGGHGLVGMGERVQLYDGTMEHGRREDGSYRVRVRLPLSEEPA